MDADWSVECGAEDPLVVVPWANAAGAIAYIDLRSTPDSLLEIPEAAQYPAIATALQRWNQPDSPIFTAKCDVWEYPETLFDAEDFPGFAFARGSYIDLIPNASEVFSSFTIAEAQLRRWTEAARTLIVPNARCEWTLRRAWIAMPQKTSGVPNVETSYNKGFSTTLYLWGYGATAQEAATAWIQALECLLDPVLAAGDVTIERPQEKYKPRAGE